MLNEMSAGLSYTHDYDLLYTKNNITFIFIFNSFIILEKVKKTEGLNVNNSRKLHFRAVGRIPSNVCFQSHIILTYVPACPIQGYGGGWVAEPVLEATDTRQGTTQDVMQAITGLTHTYGQYGNANQPLHILGL